MYEDSSLSPENFQGREFILSCDTQMQHLQISIEEVQWRKLKLYFAMVSNILVIKKFNYFESGFSHSFSVEQFWWMTQHSNLDKNLQNNFKKKKKEN